MIYRDPYLNTLEWLHRLGIGLGILLMIILPEFIVYARDRLWPAALTGGIVAAVASIYLWMAIIIGTMPLPPQE